MQIIILLSLTVIYYIYLLSIHRVISGANQDFLNFDYKGLHFIHNICIIITLDTY